MFADIGPSDSPYIGSTGAEMKNCSAQGGDASVSAFAHASVAPDQFMPLGYGPSGAVYADVSAVMRASLSEPVSPIYWTYPHSSISATAVAELTYFLATSGPIRPGVLRSGVHVDPDMQHGNNASSSWYISGPFLLGQQFEMTLRASARASIVATDWPNGGLHGASEDWSIQQSGRAIEFRWPQFFEADGVTPVQVYWADEIAAAAVPRPATSAVAVSDLSPSVTSVPEPSTCALVLIGTAAIIARRFRSGF